MTTEEKLTAQQVYRKTYREQHKDAIAAKKRIEYQAQKEIVKARTRAWKAANPERVVELAQARYQQKKDAIIAKATAWNRTHPEQRRATKRKYYLSHPEEYQAHGALRRARKRAAAIADLTVAQWQEILQMYGHRCVYCGKKSKRLTQDHLTPLSKGGAHTKTNIAPACSSCNKRKWANNVLVPVQPVLLTIA